MTASFLRPTPVVAFLLAISSIPAAMAQCTLNGAANPCNLTGPLTVTSGYTAPLGTTTSASGVITNNSSVLATAGSGSNTILNFIANTTLQGSGGTLTLNSGDNNGHVTLQSSPGTTLTNATNTIEGYGVIGNGGPSVVNAVGGTLLANVSGQTLLVNGSGTLTNNGTLQANSGATLQVTSNLSNLINSGGLGLGGGDFTMNNGTIQLSYLGTGGGEILFNESTIVLNGANARLTDAGNNNALSSIVTNTHGANFSVQGGNQLSIDNPSEGFTNYGNVVIGTGSGMSFLSFSQDEGGNTQVDGLLTVPDLVMDVNTFLTGTGQVNGGVSNLDSTVMPGDNGAPGTLTINGEYFQDYGYSATLDIAIGSAMSSLLNVNGAASLNDALVVTSYNGFSPAAGQSFEVLSYSGSLSGTFTSLNVSGLNLASGLTASLDYSHRGEILLDINGPSGSSSPEPATLAMLIASCGAIVLLARGRVV